jgi:hypothetical protein
MMMIKTTSTKIKKNSEMVSKYLDNIYVLNNEILDVDIMILGELLNDIDSWRICLDELEFKIKSHPQFHTDGKSIEYDEENKEIIIY